MRFLTFVFSIVLLAPAAAEEVRYPATGTPAVVFNLPDGWTAKPDDENNLLVASGDHGLVISMSMIEWSGPMDGLAAAVLSAAKADPPTDQTAVSFLNLKGFMFNSNALQEDGKTRVMLRLADVQVDPTHAFVCTVITLKQDDDPNFHAGLVFADRIKLAPK